MIHSRIRKSLCLLFLVVPYQSFFTGFNTCSSAFSPFSKIFLSIAFAASSSVAYEPQSYRILFLVMTPWYLFYYRLYVTPLNFFIFYSFADYLDASAFCGIDYGPSYKFRIDSFFSLDEYPSVLDFTSDSVLVFRKYFVFG